MRFLIIDTCTEKGFLALVEDDQILYEKYLPFGLTQSKHLLPELESLIKKENVGSLAGIAVGIGPGSYTGIRVGVSVAKSLSYAWKVPLIGLHAFEGYAPKSALSGNYATILDARIGGYYLAKAKLKNGQKIDSSEPSLIPASCIHNELREVDILLTPTLEILNKKLSDLNHLVLEEAAPSARWIAPILRKKIQNDEVIRDCHLELLYLRPTEAEIKKQGSSHF